MTLELPLTLVSQVRRHLAAAVRQTRSPTSGRAQVQNWLGEWWVYDLSFAIHTRAEGRIMSAFFDRLRGPATPFLFQDPSFQASVAGAVAPAITSGALLAEVVSSNGWGANTLVPAGTFFSLGSGADTRLYRIVADAQADAAGAAALTIAPRLRSAIATATPMTVANPRVRLRLTEPVPSLIARAETYTFSLRAEEAL